MEIRRLTNPWSDDIMALVQALPLCWSVQDEMHIKPVDLVRNNDFENPEIGVTHRTDLFVNVTHWRYTSQVDQYRKAFSADLAAARRACFLPELAAPYKPTVDAPAITYEGTAEVGRRHRLSVINNLPKPLDEIVDRLATTPALEESVLRPNERFGREVLNNETRAMGLGERPTMPQIINNVAKALEPLKHAIDKMGDSVKADIRRKVGSMVDVRQEWANREALRQARLREEAIKGVLRDDYEKVVALLAAGAKPSDAMTEEQIANIKAALAPVDAQIQCDMDALWPMGRIWRPTYVIPKGGNDGED